MSVSLLKILKYTNLKTIAPAQKPLRKKNDASETLFRDSRFEFQYFQISNEHSGLSYKTSSHSSEGNDM